MQSCYDERRLERLLKIAWDIEQEPSELHAGFKHKDAPETPDFDWNVFVNRVDVMMEVDRIKNSPLRQARLALNALNADLTDDNRSKAKKLMENVVEELTHQDKKSAQERQEDRERMEQEKNMFRVSTYLIGDRSDEFLKQIGQIPRPNKQHPKRFPTEKSREPVLQEEKRRYVEFRRWAEEGLTFVQRMV